MFVIQRLIFAYDGHIKMIDFCGFNSIRNRWELGLFGRREACKLCGDVGRELSENLSPYHAWCVPESTVVENPHCRAYKKTPIFL